MIILRWNVDFKYKKIDLLKYVDNFEINEEWSFLEINNGIRKTKLGWNNKNPQINSNSSLVLYRKCQVYNLEESRGNVIISTKGNSFPIINIPGIVILDQKDIPYTCIYKFDFDYHIMMIIISQLSNYTINESKKLALNNATCFCSKIKFKVYQGVISYTGLESCEFIKIYTELEKEYNKDKNDYLFINNIKNNDIDLPEYIHKSMDYEIWYKSSREMQRDWPLISKNPLDSRSIKFNNCWYTPSFEGGYIKLVERYDDNPYIYLPRQYKKNNISKVVIPRSVYSIYPKKIKFYKNIHEDYNLLDIQGNVVLQSQNSNILVYNGYVVGHHIFDKVNAKIQLLDKKWNRVRIFDGKEWHNSPGNRLKDCITIPWYYKQIIHDYNKLGRLENGNIVDLSDIGIVDRHNKDVITFPIERELYVGQDLETHRLATFKYKYNVYEL